MELREVAPGIASALSPDDQGAPYDRHAEVYDRLIGNPIYNRIAWGTSPGDYAAFAAEALASGDGPYLDVGCGTLVFTAEPYRASSRELTLSDRSVAMLEKAADRVHAPHVRYVQADVFDLPFEPGSFETVASHGVLHVLDDPWAALAALHARVAPGGSLFVSMLVGERAFSRRLAAFLHRRGEFGPPRRLADLEAAARQICGAAFTLDHTGAMAWLRARG